MNASWKGSVEMEEHQALSRWTQSAHSPRRTTSWASIDVFDALGQA